MSARLRHYIVLVHLLQNAERRGDRLTVLLVQARLRGAK